MSNFQIHELSTGALDRDSYIVHDSEVSGNFQTRKDTAGAVADLALSVVASEYDDTASYAIGSYCIYSGVLYRCTTATTGAFDVSDWTAVLITGEYKRVRVMHKADFDLLTPEEKADGMIFVDDVDITASDISYDNTSSGLSADDLQEAVDEVVDKFDYVESTSVDSVTGVTWTCKKYNNGELEIYGSKYYTPSTSIAFTAWGSLFATGFDIGTYPIAFYTPPTVIGQAQIENVACVSSTQATSSTTTAPQITCYRPTGATIETTYHINIGLYAHGRWKA